MAELKARITADPTQFYRGMNQASAFAGRAGKQIAGRFNSAFGVGFISGSAVMMLKRLFTEPFEMAKEYKEAAAHLKVTTDEYQMLKAGAEEAGLSVEEFLETLRQHPDGVQAAVDSLEKYRKQVVLTEKDVKGLNEITSFVSGGIKKIYGAFGSTWRKGYDFFTEMFTVEMLKAQGLSDAEIFEGYRALKKADTSTSGGSGGISPGFFPKVTKSAKQREAADFWWTPSVTSRQAIGAYTGVDAQVLTAVDRQTKAVEEMKRTVERIDQTVSEVVKG